MKKSAPLFSILGACILSSCAVPASRVALPGTKLTVVLEEDIKKMYSYRIEENGRFVSPTRLLGPRYHPQIPTARVTFSGKVCTVHWGTETPHHFVEFDLQKRAVLRDSNRAGHPPVIDPGKP